MYAYHLIKLIQHKKKKNTFTDPKGTADIKGIVHPKMKILSLFTHPQVVPNLYECLCSAELLKKVCNQAVLGHH